MNKKSDRDELPDKYKDLVEQIFEGAKQNLEDEKVDQLVPIAFLVNMKKQEIRPVILNFIDNAHKDLSVINTREIALETETDVVIVVTEAWSLAQDINEKIDYKELLKKYGDVEHCPGSNEVVTFSIETPEGTWSGSAPIENMDNNVRKLGELTIFKPTFNSGKLTGFLPRKPDETVH